MKTMSLRLEEEQYERLRVLSFEERTSIAELVREAVAEYLTERPIKVGQEWFWNAAWQQNEKRTEDDLATGRHETFDTMEALLDDLDQ